MVRVLFACGFNFIMEEVRRELRAGTWKQECGGLSLHSLPSLLAYMIQGCLPRPDTTQSGLGPPSLIFN